MALTQNIETAQLPDQLAHVEGAIGPLAPGQREYAENVVGPIAKDAAQLAETRKGLETRRAQVVKRLGEIAEAETRGAEYTHGAVDTKLDIAAEKSRLQAELAKIERDFAGAEDAGREIAYDRSRATRFEYMKKHPENKKQAAILKDRENFDKMYPSDVYALVENGLDPVPLLFSYADPAKTVDPRSGTLAVEDRLVTNFGRNSRVNQTVGAADILPFEVDKVEIGGQIGYRLSGIPELDKRALARHGIAIEYAAAGATRPGFYRYDESSKRFTYLPIFHGTEVTVKSLNAVTEADRRLYLDARKRRYVEVRQLDTLENDGKPLSELEADKKIAESVKDVAEHRAKYRERYGSYKDAMGEQKFMAVPAFKATVEAVCKAYGIPQPLLLTLFRKESNFNPMAVSSAKAKGLGQIIPSTWKGLVSREIPNYRSMLDTKALVEKKAIENADFELSPQGMDIDNPVHQIIASAIYLRSLKDMKGCSWGDAVIYYHTGPGFSDKHVELYKGFNPMPGMENVRTAAEYRQVAARFYEVAPYMNA